MPKLWSRRKVLGQLGLVTVGSVASVISAQSITQSRPRPTKPTSFTEKLPNNLTLEMVSLPTGEFLMGSPNRDPDAHSGQKPQHLVKVNSFAIGKYPVTQAQYQAVMGTNPSYFNNNPHNPVEMVSWNDAQDFCQKLSQITGKNYRLPTEAEWEYAYCSGTTTRFYFGDDANQIKNYSWYNENSQNTTHPVGQKKPNAWGLYDLSGNVWEWCEDNWPDNYENAPSDGSAWLTNDNDYHIVRGGSWVSPPRNCRSASRYDYASLSLYIGFRVLCVLPKTA